MPVIGRQLRSFVASAEAVRCLQPVSDVIDRLLTQDIETHVDFIPCSMTA